MELPWHRKFRMARLLLGVRLRRPLAGPWHVQIDLTNTCNNACVGCWCHSPLLGDLAMDAKTRALRLPGPVVRGLIDDLARMGTAEIYFTGGGEPLMHPEAVDLIEHVKRRGLFCDMSSNLTRLDEHAVERLVRAGMDHIHASLWAGTAPAYVRTHPGRTEADFERLVAMLRALDEAKRRLGVSTPGVRLYHVMSPLNTDDFDAMVELAYRVGAESVDFTPTDIVPGRTDSLMLGPRERTLLQDRMRALPERMRAWEQQYGRRVHFANYDQFLRRLQSETTEQGVYDQSIIGRIPCYAGWSFLRILADGSVTSCLKAVRIPAGNIYEQSIAKIWRGEKQRAFRLHTLDYDPADPYFNQMGNSHQTGQNGCLLCCDNLGLNLMIHGRLGRDVPYEPLLKRRSR